MDCCLFLCTQASESRASANQETLYHKYRQEVRSGVRSSETQAEEPKNKFAGPPGWETMVLHSQDPASHLPQPDFKQLKNSWEEKVSRVLEEESDNTYYVKREEKAKPIIAPSLPPPSDPLPKAQTSADKLNFPAAPIPMSATPGRSAQGKTEGSKVKFDIRADLAKFFEKKALAPSKGIPVLPDLPPDKLSLKPVSRSKTGKTLGTVPIKSTQETSSNDWKNGNGAVGMRIQDSFQSTPAIFHSQSPIKDSECEKDELSMATDILFKNHVPSQSQASRLEIN